MTKVFAKFQEIRKVPHDTYNFHYDGVRVGPHDTALTLEMTTGDTIEALRYPQTIPQANPVAEPELIAPELGINARRSGLPTFTQRENAARSRKSLGTTQSRSRLPSPSPTSDQGPKRSSHDYEANPSIQPTHYILYIVVYTYIYGICIAPFGPYGWFLLL
jgi:hypothetical protein